MSTNTDDQSKKAFTVAVCGPTSYPKCICKCPESCGHVFDGEIIEVGQGSFSVTCSRCGVDAMSHDLWVMP